MKTLVFFNNKGGVGKTSLVYHLAWMFHELDLNVVAADLDPQSNLSTAFLDEERLEQMWLPPDHPDTILGSVQPLLEHLGDLADPHVEPVAERLGLIVGDLGLSTFEDRLAAAWSQCLEDNKAAAYDGFRVMTSFYRAVRRAAEKRGAQLALLDVGPSLGAINRAALVASDYVVFPLGADLFSLQGLRNLGPTLHDWRTGWSNRQGLNVPAGLAVPGGTMTPAGYVVLQHAVRQDRPVKAYQRWVERMPSVYHREILREPADVPIPQPDPALLATLKHYHSLMPLAHDARKPMFFLKAADGAIGSHAVAAQACYSHFQSLALRLAAACGLEVGAGLGS